MVNEHVFSTILHSAHLYSCRLRKILLYKKTFCSVSLILSNITKLNERVSMLAIKIFYDDAVCTGQEKDSKIIGKLINVNFRY